MRVTESKVTVNIFRNFTRRLILFQVSEGSSYHQQCAHSIYSESNLPFNRAIDSATASSGGGSMALFKNSLISPSFRNLMVRASSLSGVRKISGVACSASLSK